MIGQQHITTTLVNQIKSSSIGHAYLFVGSRGTGKTTAAKIFAKSINCTAKDIIPCGKCSLCLEAELDIVEIDAASNNGVEEIRTLRQNINFMPTKGKYKVYIIDEVHMLSIGAFNALLKTLEEPPKHIVFVLATTESHRLPSTIISRCMRFDFLLVDMSTLCAHLKDICKTEKKSIDNQAIEYIAMRAEGSVRDALSILDTVFSYCDKIDISSVQSVLGSVDKAYLQGLLDSIRDCNISLIFESIDAFVKRGFSVNLLAKDIVVLARDILVVKSVSDPKSVAVGTFESIQSLKADSVLYTSEFLLSVITVFSSIDTELRYSIFPRAVLEIAALSVAKRNGVDLFSIQQRLDRLEESLQASVMPNIKNLDNTEAFKQNVEAFTNSAMLQVVDRTNVDFAEPNIVSSQPKNVEKNLNLKSLDSFSVWGKILTNVRNNCTNIIVKDLILRHNANLVDIVSDKLVVYCDDNKYLEFKDDSVKTTLQNAIDSLNLDLTLSIQKSKRVDPDDEIDRLKTLVGAVEVKIVKSPMRK